MTGTAFDVRISYRRGDRELAASLARRLEERGLACQYDAAVGGERTLAPETGPDAASVLVLLVSREPHDARDLRRELGAADRLNRPVVTFLVEAMEPRGAQLQALANRICIRVYPEPMAHIEAMTDLVATLAGKGPGPGPAPRAEPDTLEARQKSLDEAIGEMLTDVVEPASRAPVNAVAYVGMANSGGKPAPRGGGAVAGIGNVLTLGVYGAMARGRAIRSFRSNLRKL